MAPKDAVRTEFGDFQTPQGLADRVCALLQRLGVHPRSVVEPTCGVGAFLVSARRSFPTATRLVGADINPAYISQAAQTLAQQTSPTETADVTLTVADFFTHNWSAQLADLPNPVLLLGNPPWVTNSALATLQSGNLPEKRNAQDRAGIEAITGASNFDISEWMLLRMFEWVAQKQGTLAMLCKTAVARKVLLQTWQQSGPVGRSRIFKINAQAEFGAGVDACLLLYEGGEQSSNRSCTIFDSLESDALSAHIGYRDGMLISDIEGYDRWRHLKTSENDTSACQWRSGIKHDAATVMELTRSDSGYVNGLGERWPLEESYLYPMLKSSDLAGKNTTSPRRWMLVTQQSVGAETASIRIEAPLTWRYLLGHADILDRRKSSIYRNRPRFSVFGVGDYSFAPWKVAIAGLYKSLHFRAIGPLEGKPVVFDDTCYFLPCSTEDDARLLVEMLNSVPAQAFLQSLVFWEDKRPVTVRLLKRLDLLKLATTLGKSEVLSMLSPENADAPFTQLQLFEKRSSYGE
ncbi:MAG: hypothetical protein KF893_06135 [Caldilineaceae bacterium]|nr:hypothetical protein [Caldilineaceae bacterium]